jgi:DNA invertase Pin-like site-specific DNA recombinase
VRVVGYCRVSTEEQAGGFSLEVQRERITAYCEARGWTLVRIYEDDSSGRDVEGRPDYRQMLVDRETWDTALVVKLDRIHRRQRNFLVMIEQFVAWGKDFSSVTDNLDTSTAMGRFVMDLMSRIAELESDQISERVLPAMDAAKKQEFHVGAPPLGFRIDETGKKFVPTTWGLEVYQFTKGNGVYRTSQRFRYPDPQDGKKSKKSGRPLSVTAVKLLRKNFVTYYDDKLTPNRQRTAVGSHSKVKTLKKASE